MAMYDINLINADGTGLTAIASGANPDWFAPLPGRPEAAFAHRLHRNRVRVRRVRLR